MKVTCRHLANQIPDIVSTMCTRQKDNDAYKITTLIINHVKKYKNIQHEMLKT